MQTTPNLDVLWAFLIQSRVRQMRGQPAGSVEAARKAIRRVAMTSVATMRTRDEFRAFLDSSTVPIRDALPSGSWGWARKLLNLSLRDATYNAYLRDSWGLAHLEPWLEIPVDGVVAAALRAHDRTLPVAFNLRDLSPRVHSRYQAVASDWALEIGTYPVHLDVEIWSGSHHSTAPRPG